MATGSLQVNRDIILATKKQHLKQQKQSTPIDAILALAQMQARPRSILNYSSDRAGIKVIAKVSRHEVYDPVTSALHCLYNGADAITFFTDHSIYDNAFDDMLMLARAIPDVPVIFQNYCSDEYEVMAARAADSSAIFLYGSLVEKQQLRRMVSMTQRWKMSTIVQISNEDELQHALTLSPHALAFGDNLSGNIEASIEDLKSVEHLLPTFCKICLMHTIYTIDDLTLALEAPVDAVIIDELLLKHDRSATEIHEMIAVAVQTRNERISAEY